MDLRTYALAVSFASIIGLLLTIAPLARNALEYRSPQLVDLKPELASLETFVLAKGKLGLSQEMWASKQQAEKSGLYTIKFWERDEWQAMYDAERNQHLHAVRSEASRNLVAYGLLAFLCLGLVLVHVGWARRLSRHQ